MDSPVEEPSEPFLKKTVSKALSSLSRSQSQIPQRQKYKNLPRRKTVLELDATDSWKEFPDRYIVSNVPDTALPDNSIQTTKYTWLTFLPKNMYEQFSKLANLYFLIIGLLQMIEPISSSDGKPITYIPLAVIVTISAIKDLFEDLERRRSDSRENQSQTLKLTAHGFYQAKWEDLQVGDIVKVENGEFIPADMIILQTSEANGGCYIETKNLDGETNLKFKSADKSLLEYFTNEDDLWSKHVEATYEKQNPNLYNFTGTLKLDDERSIPLDNKNFLLRTCSMRSDYAIGLVAYTGHHTKIMLNSVKARPKSSRLEKVMNKQIILLVIIQSLWCLMSSIYATIWFYTEEDSVFGQETDTELKEATPTGVYFIEGFGSWIILFTNFIPISLLVTLEMVKFIQAIVLHHDEKMVDNVTHSPATVYTSRLMEEIGQVGYVFSDKTGTLTCNIMEFKKLCVLGKSYGESRNEEILESKPKVDNVDFADQEFFEFLENGGDDDQNGVKEAVFLLSICHSANLETRDGVTKYSASSPDDLAFVNFAKLCGYEYVETNEKNEIVLKVNKKEQKIKLLHQIEFSSERKMMSVIFENDKGEIVMYSKGADSAILEKMDKNNNPNIEEIKKYVHKYACEGFRTLLLAKRTIPKEIYEEWNKKYEKASCVIQDRDEEMFKCQQEIEKELVVLAATAIEDKLQDEVDETISALKEAGMKVWVLTGDKVETAINIGYSCKLLDDKQEIFTIDVTTKEELHEKLEAVSKQIFKKKLGVEKPYAIVITGYSLVDSFDPRSRTSESEKLFRIFSGADVVVGCRVSPKQKKDVVELVKAKVPTAVTLAIGDGANDVNMITAAHVGVGIKGLEGYQAARASDFAIGEFKILKRLLLFYGRETYRKNSYLVLYNFWKNVLLILPLFWYGFFNGMSGTLLYEPFIYQFFNLFFASIPIIIFAVFDQEYEDELLEKNPKLYTPGIHDRYFNFHLFWYWFTSASVQSIFIALTAFGALCTNFVDQQGRGLDFLSAGMMAYSSVVICANCKILLFTNRFNFLVAFGTIGSVVVFILTFYVFSVLSFSALFNEFTPVYTTWNFYFGTALMVAMTTLLDKGATRFENEDCLTDDPKSTELKKQEKEKEL